MIVRNMPLGKRYKKMGTYYEEIDTLPPDTSIGRLFIKDGNKWKRKRFITKKIDAVRAPFAWLLSEPLTNILIDHINSIKEPDGLLFTEVNRKEVWRCFTKQLGVPCHYFRAQRASCFLTYRGWTPKEVADWFSWVELETCNRYLHLGMVAINEKFNREDY
jgi:hypothetical protein